ncbi:hypothetical protein L7F22_029825 [Adiantum nelumboides]|nr:hypothetical protein [Adiantum nelumboides]
MANCKLIFTPLDQNFKLRIDEGKVLDDAMMYRKIVGSLIYMTISRLDLSYTIELVSQFMQLPKKSHLDAVRHILRYVRATLDYALFYDACTQVQVEDLVVIYCDNLSSIQLAQNSMFHARRKHIEVHYHFVRERILDDVIDLAYVGTKDQIADFFTKALGAEKVQHFRGMLVLRDMALSLKGSVEISSSMLT